MSQNIISCEKFAPLTLCWHIFASPQSTRSNLSYIDSTEHVDQLTRSVQCVCEQHSSYLKSLTLPPGVLSHHFFDNIHFTGGSLRMEDPPKVCD